MMDVLWALRFWKNTAKAGYLGLNRCHKQHQWGPGSSEMPSAGFGGTAVKDRWPSRSRFDLGQNKHHFTAQWERHDSIEEKQRALESWRLIS